MTDETKGTTSKMTKLNRMEIPVPTTITTNRTLPVPTSRPNFPLQNDGVKQKVSDTEYRERPEGKDEVRVSYGVSVELIRFKNNFFFFLDV